MNLTRGLGGIRVSFLFAWYDLWVGAFWDAEKRWLYVLPVPCLGVVLKFPEPDDGELPEKNKCPADDCDGVLFCSDCGALPSDAAGEG